MSKLLALLLMTPIFASAQETYNLEVRFTEGPSRELIQAQVLEQGQQYALNLYFELENPRDQILNDGLNFYVAEGRLLSPTLPAGCELTHLGGAVFPKAGNRHFLSLMVEGDTCETALNAFWTETVEVEFVRVPRFFENNVENGKPVTIRFQGPAEQPVRGF